MVDGFISGVMFLVHWMYVLAEIFIFDIIDC